MEQAPRVHRGGHIPSENRHPNQIGAKGQTGAHLVRISTNCRILMRCGRCAATPQAVVSRIRTELISFLSGAHAVEGTSRYPACRPKPIYPRTVRANGDRKNSRGQGSGLPKGTRKGPQWWRSHDRHTPASPSWWNSAHEMAVQNWCTTTDKPQTPTRSHR